MSASLLRSAIFIKSEDSSRRSYKNIKRGFAHAVWLFSFTTAEFLSVAREALKIHSPCSHSLSL